MKIIYDYESSINELANWVQKHPTLTFGKKVKEEEFKNDPNLKDTYEKKKKIYGFLRKEKAKNNMSDEQIKRCKEANIGGVFGYSEKIELIAKTWGFSKELVLEILAKYKSIEGFYVAYVNGEINMSYDDEFYVRKNVFLTVYDIEKNNNRNYNLLASALDTPKSKKELIYYSKSKLEELINSGNVLTEREMKVLKLRFGLEDGKTRTLEDVGKEFDVYRERIRQIEAKALRKLRKYKNKVYIELNLDELKPEEKQEVLKANKKLSILDTPIEEKEKSNEIIKKYIEKQTKKIEKEVEKEVFSFESIPVRDFIYNNEANMSSRLFNCLRRSKFISGTIEDILDCNIIEIRKIRNLGRKLEEELLNLLAQKGYVLNEEGNFVKKETIENKTDSVENKDTSIKMVITKPETIKQENDVLRKEIEEKQQKSELLDELIKLFDEQEELKNQNSQLDEEIKQKLAILNQKGITYEKK